MPEHAAGQDPGRQASRGGRSAPGSPVFRVRRPLSAVPFVPRRPRRCCRRSAAGRRRALRRRRACNGPDGHGGSGRGPAGRSGRPVARSLDVAIRPRYSGAVLVRGRRQVRVRARPGSLRPLATPPQLRWRRASGRCSPHLHDRRHLEDRVDQRGERPRPPLRLQGRRLTTVASGRHRRLERDPASRGRRSRRPGGRRRRSRTGRSARRGRR